MVSLNVANAFAIFNTIENDAPPTEQYKIGAMAKTISDLMKSGSKNSKTISRGSEGSWVISIITASAMILGHESYNTDIFMYYLSEAFLYMSTGNVFAYFPYSYYLERFNRLIQARDILNEQKMINWKTLMLSRRVDHGRDALLILLKARTEIAPKVINLALSTWNGEMVKALLEYNLVKIGNEVIRFVAGNLKYGKEIMEMLLAQDMEREMSEAVPETALKKLLESECIYTSKGKV
ncbi:uncharacterized protein EAE97_001532 [Botrytis byssoidea]|uniref:Uncharacterized protein n=1 Tax=Botrytis byssoidea TaxID=139641 RepID=A0A9P5LY16_9HELO|nr:uncharacterized protein EAE97_001532 [Botrytis byssoidea]KAF7952035.1 hypothetical protein EAE97_001532 [Botrytis byssoidea]